MNHVPDDAVARVDALGRAALAGESIRVRVGLRTDLRLHADYDGQADTLAVRFLHAGDPRPTIRHHGTWLATYVDGVDSQLAAWGFRTPDDYRCTDDATGDTDADSGSTDDPEIANDDRMWHVYHGTVRLPGR